MDHQGNEVRMKPILFLLSLLASFSLAQPPERLRVSSLGHYLVTQSGKPFFMLADTNLGLVNLMTRAHVSEYLQDRKEKGFNTVQTSILISGVVPNPEGVYPFEFLKPDAPTPNEKGYDFSRPIEAYWKHLDFVVQETNRLGLYVGLVVAWNNHLGGPNGPAVPLAWTEARAKTYGQMLARRYANARVIWILGGDDRFDLESPSKGSDRAAWWAAMAQGIKEATSFALISFLPSGGLSSSDVLGNTPWLSFHGQQSGNVEGEFNSLIAKDYARTPAKPVVDLQPLFEDNPFWDTKKGGWTNKRPSEAEVRRIHYWNAFSGAAGTVFGNLGVAFYHTDAANLYPGGPSMTWQEGLGAPGAAQMGHLARLMNSRPFTEARPDTGIIQDSKGSSATAVTALVAPSFAFIYLPNPRSVRVDASRFGPTKAWWFNPKNGQALSIGEIAGIATIAAAGFGPDAVLVLDQASKNYPAPGQ
jgi:hypothetical protein